jgi:hypothetical protein
MPEEQIRDQHQVFEEAKNTLAYELNPEMLDWDFSNMIGALKRAIREEASNPDDNYRSVREFSRHRLKISGTGFKRVQGWLKGEPLSQEEISLVLRTLKQKPEKESVPKEKSPAPVSPIPVKAEPPKPAENSRAKRMLIEHARGILSSLHRLLVESGVQASDAYDGDRMQMRDSMQHLCSRLGIQVVFPAETNQGTPLTRKDLTDDGLSGLRRK